MAEMKRNKIGAPALILGQRAISNFKFAEFLEVCCWPAPEFAHTRDGRSVNTRFANGNVFGEEVPLRRLVVRLQVTSGHLKNDDGVAHVIDREPKGVIGLQK